MKHLTSRHYLLLVVSLSALAAAALVYAFMYRESVARALAASAARASAVQAANGAQAAKEAQETYADTASVRAELPSFLVSQSDAVPFIDHIEAIGTSTGAAVSISSLASGPAAGSYGTITADVSVSGTWGEVMRAVGLVESLPYAVSISSLRLSQSGGPASAKSVPVWSADMAVSVLSSE